MSNWSNVVGKAGAGAAIAGVSMTYYALMRRNIELERQHQLQLEMSSEGKGNRRKSEENMKSSSNDLLANNENNKDHSLEVISGHGSSPRKFKSASASNSCLVSSIDELSQASISTATTIPSLPELSSSEVDIGEISSSVNQDDENSSEREDAVHVGGDSEKVPSLGVNTIGDDGVNEKINFSFSLPTAHCAGEAVAVTSFLETERPEQKFTLLATPQSPICMNITVPVPMSSACVSDYTDRKIEVEDLGPVVGNPSPKNLETEGDSNEPKENNSWSEMEQEIKEQGPETKKVDVDFEPDESKINAIFINKDSLLRTGDENSNTDLEETESFSSKTSRLGHQTRFRNGRKRIRNPNRLDKRNRFIHSDTLHRHRNEIKKASSPSRPPLVPATTSRTSSQSQEYIPSNSWIAWPFKIFPARYGTFVLVALAILSWLLCALIAYGIIETIYYTFGWERTQVTISMLWNYQEMLGYSNSTSDSAQNVPPPSTAPSKYHHSVANEDKTDSGSGEAWEWQWHW